MTNRDALFLNKSLALSLYRRALKAQLELWDCIARIEKFAGEMNGTYLPYAAVQITLDDHELIKDIAGLLNDPDAEQEPRTLEILRRYYPASNICVFKILIDGELQKDLSYVSSASKYRDKVGAPPSVYLGSKEFHGTWLTIGPTSLCTDIADPQEATLEQLQNPTEVHLASVDMIINAAIVNIKYGSSEQQPITLTNGELDMLCPDDLYILAHFHG